MKALLLLPLCPILLHAQAAPPGRAEIIQQLQRGDNQAALSLARAALGRTPRDCSLLSLEGIALTGLQKTPDALTN